ncbi:titin isoform X2 [Astatotilapia calliptera]|nr:titin-like isoform X2 [Astatotilapia calliptera]
MSSQNAKKKRLGSRRVAQSQNEVPKADEYHLTEASSVAQGYAADESTESLNVLSSREDSKPETRHPPSAEVKFNRRKIGSNRRSKGKQLVNDLETEPYRNPGKELEEKSRGNETFETIQTPRAVELKQQEEFGQGSDHVSALAKDCSESTHDKNSEGEMEMLTPEINNLQECNPCRNEIKLEEIDKSDMQSEEIKENMHPVAQQSSSDVPDEEPSTAYSVAEIQSTESDDKKMLRQDGRLQGNNLVNESHVEFEALEAVTPNITTDKNSPEQNIEVVCSAEQETFSSSKEKLTANEDPCSLSEVREAWQSESAMNKIHEVNIKPIEIQDMYQNQYSFKIQGIDITENAVTYSEKPEDQTEMDTHSSDMKVKNNVFHTEQEHLNEKQYAYPTNNRHPESLQDENEDIQMYDSKQQVITDIAVSQLVATEISNAIKSVDDSVSNNYKQSEHQRKEGHLETLNEENEDSDVDMRNGSVQTIPSEVNTLLESQLESNNVTSSEQTHTVYDSIGKRRKMGSTRRSKARQLTIGDETPETTEMSATEATRPEELLQRNEHVSVSVPHDSSIFTMSTPAYFPEVQKPTATSHLEISLNSLIPQSENLHENQDEQDFKVVSDKPLESGMEEVDESETALREEIKDANHSDETVRKMHEDEVERTEIQEVLQNDFSSENVIDDATENSSFTSGDLGQTENSNTYQFQVMVQSPDESVTKVEVSTPDDKQPEQHFVTQGNEEGDISDSKGGGVSPQSPTSLATPPFESQLQDNTVSTDKQSHAVTESRGNRRKMGSTRRNKGRQRDKEFKDEDAIGDETPETTEMSETEATRPEELLHLIPQSENLHENQDEQDFKVVSDKPLESGMEEVDESETALREEVKDANHSDETVRKMHEDEVERTEIQEVLQNDFSSENVIDDATENSSFTSGDLGQTENSNTYQFQVMVQSPDESVTKVEVSTPDDKQPEQHFVTQENEEGDISDSKSGGVSPQSPTSLATPPFESQLQDNTVSTDKQSHAVTESRGNRRKMGSTRRIKGRQRDKEFKDEDAIVDETPETTEMSETEATRPEELLHLIPQSENLHENQDEQDFKVVSDKPLESGMEEVDESETALREEIKDANHSDETVRKMHEDEVERTEIQEVLQNDFSSENVIDDATENSSFTSGDLGQTENSNTYQFQVMVQSPDESVTKVEVSTPDDKQPEQHFVTQENEEGDISDSKSGGVSPQSPTSLATPPFESQLQDNTVSTDKQSRAVTDSKGNRRKMGSTRRNKGRQRDKEFKDEDAIGDETPETTEMSETEATRPEELLHLIPQSENLHENQDEQDFKVVSDKPLESGMEEVDESETALREEVKDANHSDETVRKMHEDEVERTEIQEVLQNDFSSENVIDDATENSSFTSGDLGQTENSNTYQFQVMVQSPDESVTKVEVSTPDDKQPEQHFVTQENEEGDISDSKSGGVSPQSPTSLATPPFESQLQDNTVSTDKQSHAVTESRGNRRKMGSTRRIKGRQRDKEFKDEDAIVDETPETTEMSETEATRPEELLHLIPQSENLHENQDEQDFKVVSDKPLESGMEEVDESETALREEIKDANHSDETVRKMHEDEVERTEIQEVLQNDFSSENVIDDATENSSFTSGDLGQTENSNTYQFQVMVQSPDESVTKVEVSTPDDKQPEQHFVTQENEEGDISDSKSGGVSPQSPTSLATPPFESQLQDNTVSTDKQSHAVTESRGNRRKMGSTRRIKGRQRDKEFKDEDAIGDETPETTEMSETEATRPEELLHLIPQSENLHENQDEQDFKVVSDKPLESGMEEVDESETALREEVKDANHSDETVRKMHEDEVERTEIQEVLQNDFSSENVIDDATENSSFTSGDLGQTENSNTYQFQVMVQSPDESVTKVEVSTPDDKQPEQHFVTQENEEGDISDSKSGGVSPQSPTSLATPPFESQLQDNTVSTDKQSHAVTESRGNRRKMGSTRRIKGRQRDKEFKDEDAIVDETPETTEMSETEATRPEELLHLIPQSENLHENQDEQDFKVVSDKPLESGMEEVDESETALREEVKDANHSDETVRKMHEDEVERTEIQEVLQNDFSSENVIDDATENSSFTSGDLGQTENSNTYQFQVMVQSPDESVTKVEVSTPDDKQPEQHFVTQENEEGDISDSKSGGVSPQSPTSLATPPFESQLQDNTVSTDKQSHAVTESRGNRRKMGSTRRNKGRQRDKEFKDEDAIGDETPETTEMSETEATRPEELLHLIPQSENLHENQDEQDFKVVSDKPLESGMEEVDESETALREEVKDANHSDETVRKMHEDEVERTEIQEVLQNDFSSENVIDDATENSSFTSGDLGQTENSNTYQFQVMVQSPDESVTKVEVSTPDDKQPEQHFVTQENEEGDISDSKSGGVSPQSPTSLATPPFESQLQDNTVSTDKQSHAVTESRGNRRKMGSTRRIKGRQRDKEFKDEDAIVDETPETTEMSETEATRPEELLHLIPQSENLHENQDEQDFKVVSDKPLESGMEEVDESETALREEIKDANHSDETVRKMHEDEVERTEIQEVLQNDFSSENVIDDATENSSFTSGDLGQTENSNTYQFQVMVQSPDESVTKVEVSTPDDKQPEQHFVTQENEEGDISDSKSGGVSPQSPTSLATPPFESQLQDNTVSTDKQSRAVTDSKGNRRKMGSTRRNKGRQRDKEFKDEDAIGDETPETTEMSETEATRPEELLHLIPQSENLHENQDEQDFKVVSDKPLESGMEEVDESETALREEVKDANHSDETVRKMHEDEVERTEIQEVLQNDFSSENVIDDATENSSFTSGDLGQTENSNTYQFQVMVQSPDESVTKVEVSTPDDKQPEQHFVTQENEEGDISDSKSGGVSPQSPTSLATPPFESQLQDNTVSTDKQSHAVTESRGNRRKMGSTRRIKGRQRDKEFKDEDAIVDETPETTEMSETEATRPEELLHLIPQSENLHENQDEQDFKVVSDKPLESGMEEVDESETALREEIKDANHSDETVRKMHEDEVERTEIQEVLQNDFSSENVIDDATENSSFTSGDLGQTENSNTYQFQVMVQSPDESVTKVEVSTPDDKQPEQHFVTQENEEGDISDSKSGGVSPQSPTSLATPPFESQLQDNTVSTDKQSRAVTDSKGNRRKMGSTRRNKGRQRDKEFKDEDAIGDETPETTEMSETEATRPEELLQRNKRDVCLSVPHDTSMFKVSTPAYSPDIQSPTAKSYSEISLDSLISESENLKEDKNQTTFNVISDKPLESVMEEVVKSETALTEEVKDPHHPDGNQAKQHFVTQEIKGGDVPNTKDSGFPLQTRLSLTTPPFESQLQDNTVSTDKQTHTVTESRGNRRKMGSTRRIKGRQRDKEFKDEDAIDDETPETTEMSATEATRPEELLQENKHDVSLSVPHHEKSFKNQNDGDTKVINDKPVQAGMEEVKKDQHIKLLGQDGNLPSNILLSGTTDCTIAVEITTDQTSPRERTEVECSVAQETFLASQNVLTTNREQHEHCNPIEVTKAKQSEGALMHQTDCSASTESHQTSLSETNISLDFHHQDNSQDITEIHTRLSHTGNRKKMGSSRRNKGRQGVKDPDAYQEPKDDILEKPTSNDKLRTIDMSPATDITKEEEEKDLISIDKEVQISSTAKEGKNKEKLSEEDAFFSQNNMDSNTDGLLKSNKDFNEENKVVQDAMNLDQLTGCDTITKHLMQSPQASVCEIPSDMQHTSFHAGIEGSSSLKVLDKEEALEAMDASNSQQEQTQSGNRNTFQINPQQKKRKIGSSRRSQLNRKKEEETDNTDETKESDFHTEADVRNTDKLDVVELPLTTDIPQNETAQPLFSAVHKQQEAAETFSVPSSTELNVIPVVEDFKAPLPEQFSSLREETISLVTRVITGGVREVIVEPPQLDNFTNTETQITTVVTGRSRRSINQLLPPNTEAATDTGIAEESLVSFGEARQNTHSDEERPGSIKEVQDQDASEKNPSNLNEGAHNKTQEMRSESPNLHLSNRRRKMGSTRRNLGSRNKEELHQKQEVDNEAKETGTDIGETESVSRIKEEALQLHTDHKNNDGEQGKQKVFETVEISPPGQSKFKPLPEQTVEARPVSQDQLAETEHHTANDLLSTSLKDDFVSESASGGRRRKLGSNRKSRGHQRIEDKTGEGTIIDDQSGTDARISEVGKCDKKPSSGLSKSEEHSETVSEKTSAQPCNSGIFPVKENQTFSLVGNPGVVDSKSKRYNVVMIGDSSVGKTSFMKRAQSGKFSLDIPSSIGLDSLMWPVVIDGKPMILQLWDTAGQERFHSITKQVFHKAQAFLLMYDITSTNSFSAVSYWANCIQESAAENVTVLLLGNKSDCSERRVKTHQGEILAKEYDFEFMECSAATGENVIQSLEVVARKLSQRIDSREEATVLHKEPEQKKSSRCC